MAALVTWSVYVSEALSNGHLSGVATRGTCSGRSRCVYVSHRIHGTVASQSCRRDKSVVRGYMVLHILRSDVLSCSSSRHSYLSAPQIVWFSRTNNADEFSNGALTFSWACLLDQFTSCAAISKRRLKAAVRLCVRDTLRLDSRIQRHAFTNRRAWGERASTREMHTKTIKHEETIKDVKRNASKNY